MFDVFHCCLFISSTFLLCILSNCQTRRRKHRVGKQLKGINVDKVRLKHIQSDFETIVKPESKNNENSRITIKINQISPMFQIKT